MNKTGYQIIHKIRLVGTNDYLTFGKAFSNKHSEQKVYTSENSVVKVYNALLSSGLNVEIDSYELVNRKIKLDDILKAI